jgi:hypothetical protein
VCLAAQSRSRSNFADEKRARSGSSLYPDVHSAIQTMAHTWSGKRTPHIISRLSGIAVRMFKLIWEGRFAGTEESKVLDLLKRMAPLIVNHGEYYSPSYLDGKA